MSEFERLRKLCGLHPNDLAEVLENNPRAYMAVKGAVAEKHLGNYFKGLHAEDKISSFRSAQNDFEKDFYVTLKNGVELVVECKNVEVQKISNKRLLLLYLRHLQRKKGINKEIYFGEPQDHSIAELKKYLNSLPQFLRESGIPRYEFSASLIEKSSVSEHESSFDFLSQFEDYPLSIDFQRTRNSRNKADGGTDTKSDRFYSQDEIDIVAACLFSRTMNWEFVFGNRTSLITHLRYPKRYSNKLIINPKLWHFDFLSLVK